MVIAGTSPDGRIVEMIETPEDHPFFQSERRDILNLSQDQIMRILFSAGFVEAASARRKRNEDI